MRMDGSDFIIRDLESLRDLYGAPHDASLAKEVDYLHPLYQAFIRRAPFAILATVGAGALDASPRGDGPGFVEIADERTLLMPDRRGNNRVDSLRNIVADPRVGLMFLIPGVGETIRVNGTAEISVDPALLERFRAEGKLPRSVLVVHVASVFFQCAKAVVRSGLWDGEAHVPRATLPSNGEILSTLTHARIDAAEYDRTAPERQKATLY